MEAQLNKTVRKRGRPAGRNRTALSLEERKARNAFYERERRFDCAKATSELIDELGCDKNIKQGHLLSLTITHIIQQSSLENVDELKESNAALQAQIDELEFLLGGDSLDDEQTKSENAQTQKNRKQKGNGHRSKKDKHERKKISTDPRKSYPSRAL